MNTTLVILAAGLGSRFGGNKQISRVGPHGECLMEYSIHDAIEAGFDHIVFILKEDMVETVRETVGRKFEGGARIDYAVQDFSSIPAFYTVPKERVKPFGTVHALLCAESFLTEPFATVNADDYYGKEAFRILNRLLSSLNGAREAAMVPYILGNTMSENGGVTRGICRIENGNLISVAETKNIRYGENGRIEADEKFLLAEERVSMNIWGFHPDFVPMMKAYFHRFLKSLPEGEIKAECLLPIMVNDFLTDGRLTVTAEPSNDKWFGLTYKEDVPAVECELKRLHGEGSYPEAL